MVLVKEGKAKVDRNNQRSLKTTPRSDEAKTPSKPYGGTEVKLEFSKKEV